MAAFELLRTDYVDAIFDGYRKYTEIANGDGTVSFRDVTNYTQKEKSFLGARDINMMNTAINALMTAVNGGTNLYEVFSQFFAEQQELFTSRASTEEASFEAYLAALRTSVDGQVAQMEADYRSEITAFERNQEAVFDIWFEMMKDRLAGDTAGKLANAIAEVDARVDGFVGKTTVFSADGNTITETTAEGEVVTTFNVDGSITQRKYKDSTLLKTKQITFSPDGLTITEEVN